MKENIASSVISNQEKAYRYKDMRRSIEPFGHMLAHIYTIMPHPGYIMDLTTGTFESLPPLPEWQKQIDKVIKMRNEYIKINFPEFYEH